MGKTTKVIAIACVLVAVGATAAGARSGFGKPLRALGIKSISCSCSQVSSSDTDVVMWTFSFEPKINRVVRDGPSYGKLKPGDQIVAIDGYLITTVEGGRRFSRIAPGEPVVLTVRRGSQTRDETITPDLRGEETPLVVGLEEGERGEEAQRLSEKVEALSRLSEERASELEILQRRFDGTRKKIIIPLERLRRLEEHPLVRRGMRLPELPALPELPELPELPALPDIPRIDDFMPPGSFGFALSFHGSIKTGKGHDPEWRFEEPPEIHTIEPDGPADEAGLQSGDVLLRIDGVALDTEEGGRRFSDVRPGQSVEWTIRRDGKERTVEVEAVERTEGDESRGVRYTGDLGDTHIEVEGDRRVRVIEDDNTVTIHAGDATIRLKRR